MERKVLIHIIQWTISVLACCFLVWKIAVYDDYASLWNCLSNLNERQVLALLLCVALMPINMSLEAWRWKTLMPMSWREAHRQVYAGKLAGLITPWRLGEYPARGMMEMQRENEQSTKDVMAKVLSMGAVGSATMTAAIVLAGVAGIAFSPAVLAVLGDSYLYALVGVVAVLAIAYALAPQALKKYLVLFALGAITNHQLPVTNLFIYYLLVTITPNVPIVEAGVRGAWAIWVFGTMNAALAGVLLWAINTLLPCLIGLFYRKN